METPLKTWRRRCGAGWIRGADAQALCDAYIVFQEERERHPGPVRIQLCDTDPLRTLAGLFAALDDEDPVDAFITAPHGTPADLNAAEALIDPDLFWSRGALVSCGRGRSRHPGSSITRVMIPTGGTTGGLRFAVHTRATLESAARGLQSWLGGGPIDSLCLLPLHHVSGLMQAIRAYCTDGILTLGEWSRVADGSFPPNSERACVTSLVPTQLARVLELPRGADWLRGFRCVFLGGAPAWPEVLDRARAEKIALAPCYGMTETAAQVATLHPEEFLAEIGGVGAPLPHASIQITDESTGQAVAAGTEGRIVIRAQSLFCGYFPEASPEPLDQFATNDRGVIDTAGRLTVLGRIDALINTGGEKVDPVEVEAAIRALRCAHDVAVIGVPDREWGEAVVAVLAGCTVSEEELRARLKSALAAHKVPKRFLRVTALARTDAGKIDRQALRALVS